jgi:hypothetical protein
VRTHALQQRGSSSQSRNSILWFFSGSWSLHERDPSKGPAVAIRHWRQRQSEPSTSVEIGGRSAHQHRTVAFSAPHVKLEPHFPANLSLTRARLDHGKSQGTLGKHTFSEAWYFSLSNARAGPVHSKRSGWMRCARRSVPSTTLGPGRAKYAFAFTA